MLDEHVLWVVPVLGLIGNGRYVLQVFRGKARPNRVTWFLWALAPLIAFAAEVGQGVGLQAILTFMAGFGPLLVVVASLLHRGSAWNITRFDIVCGIFSLIGLGLWLITRHGNLAIAFSIIADILAGAPTVIKAYKDPGSESVLVYVLGAINSVLTLLTIRQWTFANYGFPIYLLVLLVLLAGLVLTRVGERPQRSVV